MNKIIVCDIDGTIADLSHRLHYIQDEKGNKLKNPNWEKFFDEVDKDEPIDVIIDLVFNLRNNYSILFITGRNEICHKKTKDWIIKYLGCVGFGDNLLMRKQNDYRPDPEVKPDLLKQYLKDNPDDEVAFILDDRNSMVKKWRELGYTCLQVCDGDF